MKKNLIIVVITFFVTMLMGTLSSFSQEVSISDELAFSGAIELDYGYADDRDTGDNTVNDSASDLDIGTVEVGLEVAFHEYVTGSLLLKGEALDSDDDRVFWDEAAISIQKDGLPIYFVGGRRGQPFGLFESHLINDPITQDCYEIAKTGVTVGYTSDFLDLDFSATLYKGEELMSHLNDAEYGSARDNSPAYRETDDVDSYIGNITISPVEALTLAAFYDSEPGDGEGIPPLVYRFTTRYPELQSMPNILGLSTGRSILLRTKTTRSPPGLRLLPISSENLWKSRPAMSSLMMI